MIDVTHTTTISIDTEDVKDILRKHFNLDSGANVKFTLEREPTAYEQRYDSYMVTGAVITTVNSKGPNEN